MKSKLYRSFVRHTRYFPRKYQFDFHFFWLRLNLDELDKLNSETFLFSRNRFNLFSFYDRDHIHLGSFSLKENVIAYLKEQGVEEEIRDIELVTNPRVLGYTFNPVSFYLIKSITSEYLVIEIGNTFGEQKPYFVSNQFKKEKEWVFTTQKNFYISPFSSVENSMTFHVIDDEKKLIIKIIDQNYKNHQTELTTKYVGIPIEWSNSNIIKFFFRFPFSTLRIIFAIHYHAFKLFLLKVPYWKKNQDIQLQTDRFTWKDKAFRKLKP